MASNNHQGATCSRCGCELEILALLHQLTQSLVNKAWRDIQGNQIHSTLQHINEAWSLMHSQEVAECGLVASVLSENLTSIHLWSQRLAKLQKES